MGHIEKVGWSVIVVPTPMGALFGYTVGLTMVRKPELCCEGTNPEYIHALLNTLGRRQRDTVAFDHGQVTTFKHQQLRLEVVDNLDKLVMVRKFFHDNYPAAPTALRVSLTTTTG